MKVILLFVFVTLSFADKLQNNYLPPSNAESAGGHDFLTAPSKTSNVITGFRTIRPEPPSAASNSFSSLKLAAPRTASFRTSESYTGQPIPILRSSNDNNGDGSYRFAYETENKIAQEEEGHLENIGTDQEANTVRGSYSFQAPDGQIFTVNYIADENGFRAFGDHLPTPPAIPEAIQRSLDFNRAEERYQKAGGGGGGGGRYSYFERDINGAASSKSLEFDDLNGVEVGRAEDEVHRQYLPPVKNGYRY